MNLLNNSPYSFRPVNRLKNSKLYRSSLWQRKSHWHLCCFPLNLYVRIVLLYYMKMIEAVFSIFVKTTCGERRLPIYQRSKVKNLKQGINSIITQKYSCKSILSLLSSFLFFKFLKAVLNGVNEIHHYGRKTFTARRLYQLKNIFIFALVWAVDFKYRLTSLFVLLGRLRRARITPSLEIL